MPSPTTRKRGRPRKFDPDEALARATATFLRFGYSGASLEQLTQAMEMNKPSLYAAFGDKHALYLRVLDIRVRTIGARYKAALASSDVLQDALTALFDVSVEVNLTEGQPPGCLLASPSTTEAVDDVAIRDVTRDFFTLSDKALTSWLRAKCSEDAPLGPDAIARLANAVMHSISLRARVGEPRAKLHEIGREAAIALALAGGKPRKRTR
jgi:AcrR family transcriptional regulator